MVMMQKAAAGGWGGGGEGWIEAFDVVVVVEEGVEGLIVAAESDGDEGGDETEAWSRSEKRSG